MLLYLQYACLGHTELLFFLKSFTDRNQKDTVAQTAYLESKTVTDLLLTDISEIQWGKKQAELKAGASPQSCNMPFPL